MKKSAYMLLTIVAAFAALFFLGYWMGYGITLNRANVERRIHEAWAGSSTTPSVRWCSSAWCCGVC